MGTAKCRHGHTEDGAETCFGHCVADDGDGCDPAAHGGITWVETCLECGMVREHNANGRYGETGRWRRVDRLVPSA